MDEYQKYYPKILKVCRSYSSIFYEDWAQDIWIKAITKDLEINWQLLKVVSHNYCRDMIRREKVKKISYQPSYESEFDYLQHLDLSLLTDPELRMLHLYLKGYSLKYIAELMKLKYGTATPMFSRIVIKLRKSLNNKGLIDNRPPDGKYKRRIYKKE